MDSITKSPNENFPVYMGFSTDLITGETISSKTVTCVNAATGTDSSAAIIESSTIISPDVQVVLANTYENPSPSASPSVSPSASPSSSPSTSPSAGASESASPSPSPTEYPLQTEGDEHLIQCVVTTSNGNVYQRDLMVYIQVVIDDSFTKQPDDTFLFDVDYTRRLESGDSVVSAEVSAINESDGFAASVFNTPSVITPKVGVPVYGGTDGETYRFGVRGTTNLGYTYEKFVRMNVQEF
jgi:hypothetical protein